MYVCAYVCAYACAYAYAYIQSADNIVSSFEDSSVQLRGMGLNLSYEDNKVVTRQFKRFVD